MEPILAIHAEAGTRIRCDSQNSVMSRRAFLLFITFQMALSSMPLQLFGHSALSRIVCILLEQLLRTAQTVAHARLAIIVYFPAHRKHSLLSCSSQTARAWLRLKNRLAIPASLNAPRRISRYVLKSSLHSVNLICISRSSIRSVVFS